MFGLKLFTKTKTKKFASDKDRKQYYAIQGYYKKKADSVSKPTVKSKNNKNR
jgi:hypothetical protein